MAGKPKKSKHIEKKYMTLGAYIIDKCSTTSYKLGESEEVTKHPKVDQKMLDAVGGLSTLVEQAKELEREGIPDLRQKWLPISQRERISEKNSSDSFRRYKVFSLGRYGLWWYPHFSIFKTTAFS